MPAERLTSLSTFSGLGGLDLGLEAAGFTTIGCIEADEDARRSVKANRPWPLLEPSDITDIAAELRPRDLGLRRRELSLLAGGPPCQPFSKAAQWSRKSRSGLDDPRAYCLRAFLTLVEVFLPRVLLIENVPGFVRGQVSALGAVEAFLENVNQRYRTRYRAQWRVVDAGDYGVPQHRVRAIVIAARNGATFDWPDPTHAGQPITTWDAIGHLAPQDVPTATGKWAALLPSIPEGENYLWHTRKGGGKPLFGYRTRYWSFLLKLARNRPSWTLPAQPGPSTGPFHWNNRPLAIEEMLALQTFPVSWTVEGDQRAKVRQVGNATPPLLAELMGRAMAEQYLGITPRPDLRHTISPRSSCPAASPPSAVPPEYGSLVANHPDHPGEGLGPKPRGR